MGPQDITLIIQGIAAGLLAIIPVYQKWKAAARTEMLADKEAGITRTLNKITGAPVLTPAERKAAAYSVLMTWEAWVSILLGAVLTVSAVNSFLNGRRAVRIIDTQQREISKAVDTAEKDRKLMLEHLQAIKKRLDELTPKP